MINEYLKNANNTLTKVYEKVSHKQAQETKTLLYTYQALIKQISYLPMQNSVDYEFVKDMYDNSSLIGSIRSKVHRNLNSSLVNEDFVASKHWSDSLNHLYNSEKLVDEMRTNHQRKNNNVSNNETRQKKIVLLDIKGEKTYYKELNVTSGDFVDKAEIIGDFHEQTVTVCRLLSGNNITKLIMESIGRPKGLEISFLEKIRHNSFRYGFEMDKHGNITYHQPKANYENESLTLKSYVE